MVLLYKSIISANQHNNTVIQYEVKLHRYSITVTYQNRNAVMWISYITVNYVHYMFTKSGVRGMGGFEWTRHGLDMD